jgi:DNA polymerase III epsilon subunit-like protein
MDSGPFILVVDTETNGLGNESEIPELIQLSWILADVDFNILSQENYIIKSEGFKISREIEELTGITNKLSLENGQKLSKVLDLFKKSLSKADYIIGHNLEFDIRVLNCNNSLTNPSDELDFRRKVRVCTMKSSLEYCCLEDRSGKYNFKFPSLSELHLKLFGKPYIGAHNAVNDVNATFRCFKKLVKLDILCPEIKQGISIWDICDNERFQSFPQNYAPKNGDEVEIIRLIANNFLTLSHNEFHEKFIDRYHFVKEFRFYNDFIPDEYFWCSTEYEILLGPAIQDLEELGEKLFGENDYVLLRTHSRVGSRNEHFLNTVGKLKSKDIIWKRFRIS